MIMVRTLSKSMNPCTFNVSGQAVRLLGVDFEVFRTWLPNNCNEMCGKMSKLTEKPQFLGFHLLDFWKCPEPPEANDDGAGGKQFDPLAAGMKFGLSGIPSHIFVSYYFC